MPYWLLKKHHSFLEYQKSETFYRDTDRPQITGDQKAHFGLGDLIDTSYITIHSLTGVEGSIFYVGPKD